MVEAVVSLKTNVRDIIIHRNNERQVAGRIIK